MARNRLSWRTVRTAVLALGISVWSVTLRAAESPEGVDYNDPPLLFEAPLFVWTLLAFLFLVFLGRRFAWDPLIAALDAREARVNEAYAFAKSSRAEIEDLIQQHEDRISETYDEVKEIVAAARREAERAKSEIIAQTGEEAREIQERTIAEIHAARDDALDQLSGRVDEYTHLATEQILGRALRN